jgi:predicted  nucleic acid-binding Zn-ribbon protein
VTTEDRLSTVETDLATLKRRLSVIRERTKNNSEALRLMAKSVSELRKRLDMLLDTTDVEKKLQGIREDIETIEDVVDHLMETRKKI